jgi:hypothetical protein
MICKRCGANALRVTDVTHNNVECAPSREYLRRWGKRVALEKFAYHARVPWTARRLVCDACGAQLRTIEVTVDHVPRRWTRKVSEGEEEE